MIVALCIVCVGVGLVCGGLAGTTMKRHPYYQDNDPSHALGCCFVIFLFVASLLAGWVIWLAIRSP